MHAAYNRDFTVICFCLFVCLFVRLFSLFVLLLLFFFFDLSGIYRRQISFKGMMGPLLTYSPSSTPLRHNATIMCQSLILISNGNRTEWSPIRSVIIQVITKSDDRAAGVRFFYHEYDYRPNWTTRSLITN